MDEPLPPPLPVPPGVEPSAPPPPVEPSEGEYPLASVATPQIFQDEIPFAHANTPAQFQYTSVARRPGLATAIGVIAIVVACISGLVSLGGGGEAFAIYMVSQMVARMGNNFGQLPPRPTATATVDTNPLSIADSGLVTTVLQDKLALDGARLRELTELLHKHGAAIFHTDDNSPLTEAGVKDAITETQKTNSNSSALFKTSLGTVELYPDHATFTSTDGTTTIRTSAGDHSDSVNSAAVATTEPTSMPGGTLQPGEISRALAAIRQMRPDVTVTPAQFAAIRRELSNPNQALIVSGSTQLVYYTTNTPNNELQINFSSGTLTLDAAGNVVSSVGTVNPWGAARFSVPGNWVAVVVSECAASALLAIYLLIIGIMALRGSLHSPRLLRVYAVLKIVLSIVGAIGFAGLFSHFSSGIPAAANGSTTGVAIVWAVGFFVAGIAYPIGVLIALLSKDVRQYYSAANATQL